MKHLATICYVIGIALIVTQLVVPKAPHLNWIGIAIIAGAFLLPSEKKENAGNDPAASTASSNDRMDIKADAFISADADGFSILQPGNPEALYYQWNAIESWSWTSDGPTVFLKKGGWIDIDFSTRDMLRFVMAVPSQEDVSMICTTELRITSVDSDGIIMESPEAKYPFNLRWSEISNVRFSEEDDGLCFGFANGLRFGCWEQLYGLSLLLSNVPEAMKPAFPEYDEETKLVSGITIHQVNKNEVVLESDDLLVEMHFSWSDFSNLEWQGNYWAHLSLKSGTCFDISYDDKLWLLLREAPRGFAGTDYIFRDRLFMQLSPCKICGCIAVPTQNPALEYQPSVLHQTKGSDDDDDDNARDEKVKYNFCLACENEVWTKPEFFRDGNSSEEQWLRDEQLYFFWFNESHLEKMSPEKTGEIFGFPRDPEYRVVVTKNEIDKYILEKNGSKS